MNAPTIASYQERVISGSLTKYPKCLAKYMKPV